MFDVMMMSGLTSDNISAARVRYRAMNRDTGSLVSGHLRGSGCDLID